MPNGDYPDVFGLFGYDEYDPLGYEDYLKKRKEEEALKAIGSFSYHPEAQISADYPDVLHPEAKISAAPEPSFLSKAQDWVSNLFGLDPSEVASREAAQTIARREEMAKEQAQFQEDLATHGLLGARIPGAHPEVPTPLDAIAGILMSMPGGMGQGPFESRNLVQDMRGERAAFLKGERAKPIPSEPVEDLSAAMEMTPRELVRNEVTGIIAGQPGPAQDTAVANIRLDALLNELAPVLGPHAAEILNAPELRNLGFQYEPGRTGRYGDEGKILYDPTQLALTQTTNKGFGDLIKYMIEHELAHAEIPETGEVATHALPSSTIENRVGGIEGELFGAESPIPALIANKAPDLSGIGLTRGEAMNIGKLFETRIGLPKEAWEHTRAGGEIRAGVDALENVFSGRRDILEHDPYTQHLLNQLRENVLEANLYETLVGKSTPIKSEEVVDLTRNMELTPEQASARARMEAQLAREEAQRKRDIEIDKLVQAGRNAKLAGNVEEANKINAQVLELRNAPLPVVPAKPEVTTFRESEKSAFTIPKEYDTPTNDLVRKSIEDNLEFNKGNKELAFQGAVQDAGMNSTALVMVVKAWKEKFGTEPTITPKLAEYINFVSKGKIGAIPEKPKVTAEQLIEMAKKIEEPTTEQVTETQPPPFIEAKGYNPKLDWGEESPAKTAYENYKKVNPESSVTFEQFWKAGGDLTKVEAPTPKATTEPVTEPPTKSEGVISAPANILRKILQETKLTRFNVGVLKQSLKEKGVELPAEIEKEIPALVKELKDQGWLQEKIGGTYTLLAAPGKTMKGISKGKPLKTGEVGKQITETLKAAGITPTPTVREKVKAEEGKTLSKLSDASLERLSRNLPEGKGKEDVINEIARRKAEAPIEEAPAKEEIPTKEEVPTGTPNLEERMKAELTDEEIGALGKLFGTTITPKKGTKEIPEEVRLAREAALKRLAEGETKKAEGKPPEGGSEEVSEAEGRERAFDVTLNDGTIHIVKATSPEEARSKTQEVLDEYGSTKTVDKIEKHLTTLEKAAKYEIEPVKVGSEAVAEELKETKKGVSEEVKETTKLGKVEEQLRKAQTKEKFKKRAYNVALSNGRTTVIIARNEKVAREIAESKIKKMGAGVTIESIGAKPSTLEAAIMGATRKVEESGFVKLPLVRASNAIKSIAFGGDVGHLLRQGKQMVADLLFSKHAKKVLDQFPVMYKGMKSQEYFDKYHENMYKDPLIKKMVDDFGLDMPGMGEHYKEEVFHGAGLAEKIPIIGRFYAKPSERLYTIGLNFLRNATVHKWAETLQKEGFTPDNAPEKYTAMAKAINIVGQRGSFNPAWQKIFSDASAVYGAPRAKAARLQNAFSLFSGGTKGRIVRQTAAKTMAFNMGLLGLLKATIGAEFITNPESSDFGKFRISKHILIDPWAGLGVTARTVAKLKTKHRVSPYTGKRYPVKPGEALLDEFLGGVAPGVKLAWEAFTGTDIRGYQVEQIESLLNVAPLTAKSIVELLKEGDLEEALLLSMLQAGGEGVDVFDYEKARAKEKRLKQERGIGSQSSKGGGVSLPF